MIIGQKDSKLLILNIPFWHPESFVVSADGKEKKEGVMIIYYFPTKHSPGLLMSKLTHSGAAKHQAELLLQELFGTTWISLMNSRAYSSPTGILTKCDGKTGINCSFLLL